MKNDSGCVTEPLSIMICLIYVFCVFYTAVRDRGDSAMDKLLFKLLASIEEIKQTQRLHSATLQSIMRQLKNSDVPLVKELPEAIRFPIKTSDESMILSEDCRMPLPRRLW